MIPSSGLCRRSVHIYETPSFESIDRTSFYRLARNLTPQPLPISSVPSSFSLAIGGADNTAFLTVLRTASMDANLHLQLFISTCNPTKLFVSQDSLRNLYDPPPLRAAASARTPAIVPILAQPSLPRPDTVILKGSEYDDRPTPEDVQACFTAARARFPHSLLMLAAVGKWVEPIRACLAQQRKAYREAGSLSPTDDKDLDRTRDVILKFCCSLGHPLGLAREGIDGTQRSDGCCLKETGLACI